jgi:hypothetical protein
VGLGGKKLQAGLGEQFLSRTHALLHLQEHIALLIVLYMFTTYGVDACSVNQLIKKLNQPTMASVDAVAALET